MYSKARNKEIYFKFSGFPILQGKEELILKVAIYCRVRNKNQVNDMEVQRQEIIDFCEKSGLTIEKEFLEYASANEAFKPEFERLKAAVGNREVDKIVITELSKTNRNLNNFLEFNELLSLNNVELIGTRLEKVYEFKILHGRRS